MHFGHVQSAKCAIQRMDIFVEHTLKSEKSKRDHNWSLDENLTEEDSLASLLISVHCPANQLISTSKLAIQLNS